MPSFRRRASVIDTDRVEQPANKPEATADATDVLALAEEAEAQAAEAEAMAAAARARARALRLRREAQAAEDKTGEDKTGEDKTGEAESVGTDEQAETVDEPVDEPAAGDDIAGPVGDKPSGRRWGRILKFAAMGLAILCTGALLAASGYMIWHHREAVAEQQLTAEFSAAARQSVVTLMALDFNKVEDNVKSIIDNSTGQFKEDFENQAPDFVKVAKESKVVTDVTVTATAIENMKPDSAVALVSATSRVTNAAGANQEPRAWRLAVHLQKDGDQIKMSKVEFVL